MKKRIPEFDDFVNESKKSEKVYKSKIDNQYDVMIVYPSSDMYDQVLKIIPGDGLAITNVNKKIILIDGGKIEDQKLTKDHLNFIEAHEVVHHYLEHVGKFGIAEQEKEADYGAYLVLLKKGMKKSAKLVVDFFNTRHGETFEDFKKRAGEQVETKLNKFL